MNPAQICLRGPLIGPDGLLLRRLTMRSSRRQHQLPSRLTQLRLPRLASTAPGKSAKALGTQKTPPKYPPIKPDPYKVHLAKEARIANHSPAVDIRGRTRSSLTNQVQQSRSINRKISIALFLFVVGVSAAQWAPALDTRYWNDTNISAEDRKKFEEAAKSSGGGVIIKETTNIGQTVETVPSGTSSVGPLPKQIFLPAGVSRDDQVLEEYTLVGNGIRTVSFLGIQVYVVALYVATSSLPTLQQKLLQSLDLPSSATTATLPERETLRQKLLSDPGSIEFFSALLDSRGHSGIRTAIRIIPTRGTDYPHLRDGWVRGIQGKTQLHPEIYDDDAFLDSISRFKALFGGKGGVPKGRALILTRDENGALFAYGPDEKVKTKDVKLLSQGASKDKAMDGLKMLGAMDDPRISRALWLCYFAGAKVASEGARKSVVEGLVEVVSRPVGSTEGMVV